MYRRQSCTVTSARAVYHTVSILSFIMFHMIYLLTLLWCLQNCSATMYRRVSCTVTSARTACPTVSLRSFIMIHMIYLLTLIRCLQNCSATMYRRVSCTVTSARTACPTVSLRGSTSCPTTSPPAPTASSRQPGKLCSSFMELFFVLSSRNIWSNLVILSNYMFSKNSRWKNAWFVWMFDLDLKLVEDRRVIRCVWNHNSLKITLVLFRPELF